MRLPELPEFTEKDKHALVAKENVMVGVMFGSKALVQLIANPMVGPLTNRYRFSPPLTPFPELVTLCQCLAVLL